MKNLIKTLMTLLVLLSLTSCQTRVQTMNTETGEVSTIRTNNYKPEQGDTIVVESSTSSRYKNIYGKYVGKLPESKTFLRISESGKKITTILSYKKEIVININ